MLVIQTMTNTVMYNTIKICCKNQISGSVYSAIVAYAELGKGCKQYWCTLYSTYSTCTASLLVQLYRLYHMLHRRIALVICLLVPTANQMLQKFPPSFLHGSCPHRVRVLVKVQVLYVFRNLLLFKRLFTASPDMWEDSLGKIKTKRGKATKPYERPKVSYICFKLTAVPHYSFNFFFSLF